MPLSVFSRAISGLEKHKKSSTAPYKKCINVTQLLIDAGLVGDARANWRATMNRNYDMYAQVKTANKAGDPSSALRALCSTGASTRDFYNEGKVTAAGKARPLRKSLRTKLCPVTSLAPTYLLNRCAFCLATFPLRVRWPRSLS